MALMGRPQIRPWGRILPPMSRKATGAATTHCREAVAELPLVQISVLVAIISCNTPERRSGRGFPNNIVCLGVSRNLRGSRKGTHRTVTGDALGRTPPKPWPLQRVPPTASRLIFLHWHYGAPLATEVTHGRHWTHLALSWEDPRVFLLMRL